MSDGTTPGAMLSVPGAPPDLTFAAASMEGTSSFCCKHPKKIMVDAYELSKPGNRFHFTLAIDGQHSWDLLLDYHDLRGPNYREGALTEQGPKVLPRRPNITVTNNMNIISPTPHPPTSPPSLHH